MSNNNSSTKLGDAVTVSESAEVAEKVNIEAKLPTDCPSENIQDKEQNDVHNESIEDQNTDDTELLHDDDATEDVADNNDVATDNVAAESTETTDSNKRKLQGEEVVASKKLKSDSQQETANVEVACEE